jgi:hypothetical protein
MRCTAQPDSYSSAGVSPETKLFAAQLAVALKPLGVTIPQFASHYFPNSLYVDGICRIFVGLIEYTFNEVLGCSKCIVYVLPRSIHHQNRYSCCHVHGDRGHV